MIKKNIIYTIEIIFFGLIFFLTPSFAEKISCDNLLFNIVGQQQVISGKQYSYNIDVKYKLFSGVQLDNKINQNKYFSITGSIDGFLQYVKKNSKNNITIFRNNYIKKKSLKNYIDYVFDKNGNYKIVADIKFNDCNYNIEKKIIIFNKIYVYIGNFLDIFNSDIDKSIEQNKILLKTNFVSTEIQKDKEKSYSQIENQLGYLQNAEDIFFHIDNYGLLFDSLQDFQKEGKLNIKNKHIFLVSNVNKTILKKFLAKFIKNTNISSIYVINSQEFNNILLNLSIGKVPYNNNFLKSNIIDLTAYKLSYTISHLLDYLVYHGFPLDTLTMFLSISLAILLIIFCKQVIGLSSFNVFYPLLFGFSLHTVGIKTSIGMLLVSFVAIFFVNLISKKINILISAKIGLTIVLYTLLFLLSITIYKILGFSQNNFLIFENPMIMIVFITILMIGKKLWNKTFPLKDINRWKSMIRFLRLSWMTYYILSSVVIHEYLLIHPGIVIIVLFVIFFLGRFTGLQFVEFIRFSPLLKKIINKKI